MLAVKNLCFGYDKNTLYENFSLAFSRGKLHCILGQNGSGKSTFMRAMLGLLPFCRGNVFLDGLDILMCSRRTIARKIAYVPQSGIAVPMTVHDTVRMGRLPYRGIFTGQKERAEENAMIEHIMEKLGIWAWKNRLLSELSGGERQKVFLAKALAQQTTVLFFDEPTNNLDIRWQLELYGLFQKIVREENKLVVVVEHDLDLAARHADEIHILKDRKIFVSGSPDNVMDKDILQAVYGVETVRVQAAGHNLVVATKVCNGTENVL